MTAPRYVLAIDEGSSGVRALLFDRKGRVAGRSYRAIGASCPSPGRVEQDAELIWTRTLEVAREALAQAKAMGRDVAAIGLTGQRSTAVAWHRSRGTPLHAALSWQDLRTVERCGELLAEGHFVTPLAAATKLEWLIRNVREVREAAGRGDALFGTIESWLVWKLSGGRRHLTDASFASASGLYDHFSGGWNPVLCGALGLPENALPEIRPSSETYGEADAAWLGAPVPIAGMAGDQQAALFGQTCFEPGCAKTTYGTSAMVDLNVGPVPAFSSRGAYPLVAWKLDDEPTFCLEGQAITAGAAIQWLRDGLGILESPAESDRLARTVPDTGGAWAVPAFQGLGTPYLDSAARAAIGGLSRSTTRAHVVRAMLEGIAFRCREVVEAVTADFPSGRPEVLRVDGGAAANDFILQIQSDVLGIPVERPETLEAASTGAAFLAGLAVGFWPEKSALKPIWRLGARFEPRMGESEREERYASFQKIVAAIQQIAAENRR